MRYCGSHVSVSFNHFHPPVRGSQDMTPTPPRDTLFKLYVLVWIPPGGIILIIEKF